MVQRKEIFALEPIADDQFQPASLDLRLGATAYRVRASFLPGEGSVKDKLDELAMHEMDISDGARAREGLRLHHPAARRASTCAIAPRRWATRRARPAGSTSSPA